MEIFTSIAPPVDVGCENNNSCSVIVVTSWEIVIRIQCAQEVKREGGRGGVRAHAR